MKPKSQAVLITGTPHSGTDVVAEVLHNLGVDMGRSQSRDEDEFKENAYRDWGFEKTFVGTQWPGRAQLPWCTKPMPQMGTTLIRDQATNAHIPHHISDIDDRLLRIKWVKLVDQALEEAFLADYWGRTRKLRRGETMGLHGDRWVLVACASTFPRLIGQINPVIVDVWRDVNECVAQDKKDPDNAVGWNINNTQANGREAYIRILDKMRRVAVETFDARGLPVVRLTQKDIRNMDKAPMAKKIAEKVNVKNPDFYVKSREEVKKAKKAEAAAAEDVAESVSVVKA